MCEVARATSLAPTFFAPAKIATPESIPAKDELLSKALSGFLKASNYFSFVDGGVFASNPANCALVEALAVDGSLALEDVQMVSLGTGEFNRPLKHQRYARGGGLLNWAGPVVDVVFAGVSDTTDYHNEKILGRLSEKRATETQPT